MVSSMVLAAIGSCMPNITMVSSMQRSPGSVLDRRTGRDGDHAGPLQHRAERRLREQRQPYLGHDHLALARRLQAPRGEAGPNRPLFLSDLRHVPKYQDAPTP